MALILKQYKTPTGEVNFPAVFHVPTSERLPALCAENFIRATALVVGALTVAFERMSFKKKMTGVVINNIADEIINSCDEDNLSMEDLLLFLSNLVRGKYGNIEELSISRFMNLFDKYRDDRHLAIVQYRENEHLQHRGIGNANRTNETNELSRHFSNFANTISDLKSKLREQRKEDRIIKQAKDFYGD